MNNKNEVNLKFKIRYSFYAYLFLLKIISFLNYEKGLIAYDVLLDRVEKYPKLFIKVVRCD